MLPAAAFVDRPVQGCSRLRGDFVAFGLEFVIFDLLDPDGLKRPVADMQGQPHGLDAARRERLDQRR